VGNVDLYHDCMGEEDFDQRYQQLLEALADLVALLREYGESAWAAWLDRDRQWIQRGDAYGLEHLLGAFGGMGSLNDLLLHPANGHPVAPDRIDLINNQLQALRGQCWRLATDLRHELNRSEP
jgi:hypothetical protein